MTTFNRRSRRKLIYQWIDDISWWTHRTGFMDGVYVGLMLSTFSVLMAFYLISSI